MLPCPLADNDIGVFRHARQRRPELPAPGPTGIRVEVRSWSRAGIASPCRVHMLPAQGQNLIPPHAGEYQQPDGRDHPRRFGLLALGSCKRQSQAAQLPRGQKPLPGLFLELLDASCRVGILVPKPMPLAPREKAGEEQDGPIGGNWCLPEPVVEIGNIAKSGVDHFELPKHWFREAFPQVAIVWQPLCGAAWRRFPL